MKLLLDECVPKRLKRSFTTHDILTVDEAGFKGLKNGKLIQASADDGFEVLITVDKNIAHQQNKLTLPISIIILAANSNRLDSLLPLVPKALEVLENIKTGDIATVSAI